MMSLRVELRGNSRAQPTMYSSASLSRSRSRKGNGSSVSNNCEISSTRTSITLSVVSSLGIGAPSGSLADFIRSRNARPSDYSVLENGVVVGRIFQVQFASDDKPWIWAFGQSANL